MKTTLRTKLPTWLWFIVNRIYGIHWHNHIRIGVWFQSITLDSKEKLLLERSWSSLGIDKWSEGHMLCFQYVICAYLVVSAGQPGTEQSLNLNSPFISRIWKRRLEIFCKLMCPFQAVAGIGIPNGYKWCPFVQWIHLVQNSEVQKCKINIVGLRPF